MLKKLGLLTAVVLLGATLTAAGDGSGRNFSAVLTGDQEVPPVETETSGRVQFHANNDETEIRFKMKLEDGTDLLAVAGAHIHCAPAGQNGPVVAFLAAPVAGGLDGKVKITGTLTTADIVNTACGATTAELLDSMQAGGAYVNVHSAANPPGEVRGQIG